MAKGFDSKCLELAQHFASGATREEQEALAQAIQDFVEERTTEEDLRGVIRHTLAKNIME